MSDDRFVTADEENLHTGDAWGKPINPYSRLAFAKGLHARLGAGADSVLAHLREELLCEQIVSTTVTAERQDRHGSTYEGEHKDDKRHGQGKLTFADGTTYEGRWKDGKPHGQGKQAFADGTTYEGRWKDGNPHGQGKQTLTDGSIYEVAVVFFNNLQARKQPYRLQANDRLEQTTDAQIILTLIISLIIKAAAGDSSADNLGASQAMLGVILVAVNLVLPVPTAVLAEAVEATGEIDLEMTDTSSKMPSKDATNNP